MVSHPAKTKMPVRTDAGHQSETFSSNTVGHLEMMSSEPLSILPKTKQGEALLANKTATKVTTTYVSTKITTTKMAIGDDSSIGFIVATNGMAIEPSLPLTFDENEDPNRRPRSGSHPGGDEDHARKVSFPQEALSSRGSTATSQNIAYSGRLLKNGFRLFKANWHPVEFTLYRDGNLDWTNVDDKNHTHKLQLRDLPNGCVVLGKTCLAVPTYLSPKLGKSLAPDRLVAIAKSGKSKVKSYWFFAESDEEMEKVRTAFAQVLGRTALELPEEEVRKVWKGQKDSPATPQPEIRVHAAGESSSVASPPKRVSISAHRASLLSPIDDDEGPDENIENVSAAAPVIKQRPDSKIIAEELLYSQTSRQVETPRRKPMSAKEAFFAPSP